MVGGSKIAAEVVDTTSDNKILVAPAKPEEAE